MTPLLSPALQQELARKKLGVQFATAQNGVGERRSKNKGAGMEFADHRPYQMGDDIRHLDPYLQARLGDFYIRQYTVYQQLAVNILLDTSASMLYGSKQVFAKQVVAALGYLALAGGDTLHVAQFSGSKVERSMQYRGVNRHSELLRYLENIHSAGDNAFTALNQFAGYIPSHSLCIVISDFLTDNSDEVLHHLHAKGIEVVVVQVLNPEEIDPSLLGKNMVRLADLETAEVMDVMLDTATLKRYGEHFTAWTTALRENVLSHRGRYFLVSTSEDIARLMLKDWQYAGFVI